MGLSQTRTTWNQYACPYFLHCPQSMSESDVWLLRASLSGRRPPARSFSVFLVIRRNWEILSLIFSISPSRARSLSSVESSPRLFLEPPLFLAPFCLFGLAELEFDIGFFSSFLSGAPGRFFGAAFPWVGTAVVEPVAQLVEEQCRSAQQLPQVGIAAWQDLEQRRSGRWLAASPDVGEIGSVEPYISSESPQHWWIAAKSDNFVLRCLLSRRAILAKTPVVQSLSKALAPCFSALRPTCPPSTTLSHNFVTHNSFTHNFVTHNSFPHNIVTCNSLHANTQLFPPQHCYTYTYTYSYADTYTYTYTHKQTNKQRNKQTNKQRNKQTNKHTHTRTRTQAQAQLCHSQHCHTWLYQAQLHNLVTHNSSKHNSFTRNFVTQLCCGRRDTYGTGLAPAAPWWRCGALHCMAGVRVHSQERPPEQLAAGPWLPGSALRICLGTVSSCIFASPSSAIITAQPNQHPGGWPFRCFPAHASRRPGSHSEV